MEVSEDGKAWKQVANGEDRLPVTANVPRDALLQAMTVPNAPDGSSVKPQTETLRREEAALTPPTAAYIGQFTLRPTLFSCWRAAM